MKTRKERFEELKHEMIDLMYHLKEFPPVMAEYHFKCNLFLLKKIVELEEKIDDLERKKK